MSLPGGWKEDSPKATTTPPPPVGKKRIPRPSNQRPDYINPAVTQFCNEHFKELDDLKNVDEVIASLRIEQDGLAAKIVDSENRINSLRRDILDKSRIALSATSAFQTHYHDLTSQIQNSWTANYAHHEGLAQLQVLDSKRRDLLRARSYIQILLLVQDISDRARQQIASDPHEALKTYAQLRSLSNELQSRNEKAWGSVIHLIEYVETSAKQLWEALEDTLSIDMIQALKLLDWPNAIQRSLPTTSQGLTQLNLAFRKLAVFQQPLGSGTASVTLPSSHASGPLLPFKVMAKDIDTKFRYHFESNRPTNNIEKPEWFFQHILTTLQTHSDFMNTEIQSILNEIGLRHSALAEFITALLPILQRKIDRIIPDLLYNAQLLSHFMHENLVFDSTLRERYMYLPSGKDKWAGLIQHSLSSHRVFVTWLDVEKDFAMSRYNDILSGADAAEIEYEGIDALEIKPTKGAMRVMDLLETFTDRFRGLAVFEQRLQFIVDVQIGILELYHSKWKANVEKFEMSHPYALAGELREEGKKIAGVSGLERLCRIYGTATWVEDHLKDWTDEVFLEVYSELLDQIKADKPVAPYTIADLATRLSTSISRATDDGTLFDVPMHQFHSLKDKSITLIQAHLKKEIFEEFRQYTNLHHWGSIGNQGGEEFSYTTTTNSRELLNALPLISSMFGFLHKTISRHLFTRIFKEFSLELQAYFWEWIVTAHRFTAPGGILFARDMYALWDACGKFLSRPEQHMKRLHDAVVLLSLPGSVGVVPAEGEITLATVVKRLRDTDERDVVQATEMKTWLAENLEVKSLGLEEVLYIVRRRQEVFV